MSEKLVRIEALRAVMDARGLNASDLGRMTGKQPSYFYGLLAGNKSFGEKVARSLEEDLGLARGHLDRGGDRPRRRLSQVKTELASRSYSGELGRPHRAATPQSAQ